MHPAEPTGCSRQLKRQFCDRLRECQSAQKDVEVVRHATWQAVLKDGRMLGQVELHMNAGAGSKKTEQVDAARGGRSRVVSSRQGVLQLPTLVRRRRGYGLR